MALSVMNRIWWREDIEGSDKWVLLALADAANDDGFCWMAVQTIGIKAGVSARTVQGALRRLESKTFIAVRQRTNRSSYFLINLNLLPQVERVRTPKDVGPEETLFTGAFAAPVVKSTPADFATTPADFATTPAESAPRTVIEPSIEPISYGVGDLKSPIAEEELPLGDTPAQASGAIAVCCEDLAAYVERRFNEIASQNDGIARCRKVDPALGDSIRARAREHAKPGQSDVEVWEEALSLVLGSRFLCGRVPPRPGSDKSFRLTLGWMSKRANFREIIGGKYNGKDREGTYDARTGDRLGPTAQAISGTIARLRLARERSGAGGDQDGAHSCVA